MDYGLIKMTDQNTNTITELPSLLLHSVVSFVKMILGTPYLQKKEENTTELINLNATTILKIAFYLTVYAQCDILDEINHKCHIV
jgi:hypothetical protein